MNRIRMRECEHICKRRIKTDNGQCYVSSYRRDYLSNQEKNVALNIKIINKLNLNNIKLIFFCLYPSM